MMLRNASTDSSDSGLALVSGEEHLHVGGLAVGALGPCGGQRVAPEVLDVLDVLGVRRDPFHQVVVEAVGVYAEGLVALEDDHGFTVGVEFVKHLADAG